MNKLKILFLALIPAICLFLAATPYSSLMVDSTGLVQNANTTITFPNSIAGNGSGLTGIPASAINNLVPLTYGTNTIPVTSTGVTNNTAGITYLLTITAGTGLSLKDQYGNGFGVPVLGDTVPLKPGWRFTGLGVTAQCYQLWP